MIYSLKDRGEAIDKTNVFATCLLINSTIDCSFNS